MPLNLTRGLYARTCSDTVAIRRFSGTGAGRSFLDYPAKAKMKGNQDKIVVGEVTQYDYQVIVNAEDLVKQGVTELRNTDQLIHEGKAYGISFPDNFTRRDEGELVAWVVNIRGR